MKKRNNDFDDTIYKLLYGQRRPLSTRRIATKTDMTWFTVKKHTDELFKKHYIKPVYINKRKLWTFNEKLLRKGKGGDW